MRPSCTAQGNPLRYTPCCLSSAQLHLPVLAIGGKMLQMRWMLATVLVIGSVLAIEDQEIERVKRQGIALSTMFGPNRELSVFSGGRRLVYLTGFNANRTVIGGTQTVMFSGMDLIVTDIGGPPLPFDDVTQYTIYTGTGPQFFESTMPTQNPGPGVLYTSTGLALFTNVDPVRSIIDGFIDSAPPLLVNIEVIEVTDAGRQVSRLVVNDGEFTITATGASTARLGSTTDQRITYSGNTVTVQQGSQTMTFDGITTFGAYRFPPGDATTPAFTTFSSGTTEVFRGPGQLYVNDGESTAFYIEDFSFRSGGTLQDVSQSINQMISSNTINIQPGDTAATVTDNLNNPVITLTSSTRITNLPAVTMATYSGSAQTLTFMNGGTNTFNNVMMFSVYDNNDLTTYTTDATVTFSTGGSLYFDDIQGTALFSSDGNPAVNQMLMSATPSVTETFDFNLETGAGRVRSLSVTRTNISSGATQTEMIQTLTGAYVTTVGELQSLRYNNNQVSIVDSAGDVLQRIENVDELVVNTGSIPFERFSMSSSFPIAGPGTLSYSRGTAFYTSNPALGSSITSFSQSAPIPDIDFEGRLLTEIIIDDVPTEEREVLMIVGDDTVVTFEATSFNTNTEQEVLYSDNRVTVHQRPASTSSVEFSSNTQTVTYTTDTGEVETLNGVMTFNLYTGGAVTTADNFTSSMPGSLYVSDDGTEVLFTTSNVITSEVAMVIRGLVPIEFMVNADQFSSIYTGVYNLSTGSATVLYPGGGIIYSDNFNGTDLSFYTDDEGVIDRILRDVSSFLLLTKTQARESDGFININFNGRTLYTFAPVPDNRDILIGSTDTFIFNGTALVGDDLPDGPYGGINEVIYFNGIEVKVFNISNAPMEFEGRGLLLTRFDSDVAFYTTSPSGINFLLQAIALQRRFLIAPELQPPRQPSGATKFRSGTFDFGQRVTAYEGADVTFTCTVLRGRPEPNIQFFFGDQLLNDTSPGYIITNDTLTVTDIELDDSGNYRCVADSGIPPAAELTSRLTVRSAVAPRVRPYWFPFPIEAGQRLFWPDSPPVQASVDVQRFDELVFACRVEGRPKAEVMWTINSLSPGDVVQNFTINETRQGRSVLIIDITDDDQRMLFSSQSNIIECTAMNDGGSTSGSVVLSGSYYQCMEVTSPPPECSRSCGFGTSRVVYTCDRTTNGVTETNVSLSEVPSEEIPDQVRICTPKDADQNAIICPLTEFEWNTTEWTECSRTCGGGSQTRNVSCLEKTIPVTNTYLADLNNTEFTEVDEGMCVMFEGAGTKPAAYQLCNQQECPFWQTGQFSDCSVTCGGGVRMRTVECVMEIGRYIDMNGKVQLNLTILNDSACNQDDRPSDTRVCNTFPCFFKWRSGSYGQCGEVPIAAEDFDTCKFRDTFCYNDDPGVPEDMRVVDDAFCDGLQRPTALTSCDGECLYGIWTPGPWSNCSEACGFGTETRSLQCLSPKTFVVVPDNFCLPFKRPPTSQQCFIQNCPGMCVADESDICPLLARNDLCDSALAMGSTGMRCCYSCMGTGGGD